MRNYNILNDIKTLNNIDLTKEIIYICDLPSFEIDKKVSIKFKDLNKINLDMFTKKL